MNLQFLSPLLLIMLTLGANAQTVQVGGTVTISSLPVHNASITFIDNSDTTRQFSSLTNSAGEYSTNIVTSVEQVDTQPSNFTLEQNYPNPFSSATAISYRLHTQSDVQITIYDILGREVRKISIGTKSTGAHRLVWDGLNNSGEGVAAGIYFYRLQVGSKTQVRKMIFGTGLNSSFGPLPKSLSSQATEVNSGSTGNPAI